MSLTDEISKQIISGQGLRFDAAANALYRAVGRKAAQQAADKEKLDKLDAAAKKADDDAKAEQAEIDKLRNPGELRDNPTAAEQAAFDAYQLALKERSRKKSQLESRTAEKKEQAAKIRAFHETLGEQKILNINPKRELLKDLNRFIERNVGPSACKECCSLVDSYIENKPAAALVKIKNFDGDAVVIADADGTVICRAGVVVASK